MKKIIYCLSLVLFMTISSSTAISGTEKLKNVDEVLLYCNTKDFIKNMVVKQYKMQLAADGPGYLDYSDIGGITSSLGSGANGDILFTTTGAGAVGDTYNVVFRMIKEY